MKTIIMARSYGCSGGVVVSCSDLRPVCVRYMKEVCISSRCPSVFPKSLPRPAPMIQVFELATFAVIGMNLLWISVDSDLNTASFATLGHFKKDHCFHICKLAHNEQIW